MASPLKGSFFLQRAGFCGHRLYCTVLFGTGYMLRIGTYGVIGPREAFTFPTGQRSAKVKAKNISVKREVPL